MRIKKPRLPVTKRDWLVEGDPEVTTKILKQAKELLYRSRIFIDLKYNDISRATFDFGQSLESRKMYRYQLMRAAERYFWDYLDYCRAMLNK